MTTAGLTTGVSKVLLDEDAVATRVAELGAEISNDYEGRDLLLVGVRYTGFEIPNEFVIGYGLDFGERYRNLPYVAVLDPESIP